MTAVLEFLYNLWGLGTEFEQDCRTGPPGCVAWRNWLLGIDSFFKIFFGGIFDFFRTVIDSLAPYKFKNSGSVIQMTFVLYFSG